MKIKLSQQLIAKIPGISCAAIVLKNVNNKRKNSSVEQLLRGVCAQKRSQFKKESNKEQFQQIIKTSSCEGGILPEIQLLESIVKKIQKDKDLALENNLYGLVHHAGLKYLLPVFGVDLDQVEKDIVLDFITPKRGKKAQDLEFSTDTKNILVWVIDLGTLPKETFAKIPSEVAKLIQKYCSGHQLEIHYLNSETPEVDLGYISDKEAAYLEEQTRIAAEQALSKQVIDSDLPPFIDNSEVEFEPEPLIKDQLATIVKESIGQLLKDNGQDQQAIDSLLKDFTVETPAEVTHGDYATSIALKLSKILGKNPREIAIEIQKLLTASADAGTGEQVENSGNKPKMDFIEKIEIAGPGFINFSLSQDHLKNQLEKILKMRSNFGRLTMGKGQKVIIEYSQPNIAKPLGVHHLLSTIIGQTLVDMFRFAGYDVLAINYPGDWGTQFGKLIYAYKTWGDQEIVKKDPLNELLKLYVQFHNEAEKDPTLDDKGRAEFKKLEDGDIENRELWQWIKDVSISEIERIYQKLDVHFDIYLGEEMHREEAKKLVEEGMQKGIITEGEKGALIVKFAEDKLPPYMVQKADGATLYSSRDIASIKYRNENFNPDKIVYVVDVAQSLHFKQLFETAKLFGLVTAQGANVAGEMRPELVHVSFGRMQFPEGRMSTRKGEVVLLDEVIKEGTARTEKIVAEKSRDTDLADQKIIAEEMAIGAIKYNVISQNRETNLIFDWDRMLSLDGNSGPYLQYACARAQSILRKFKDTQLQDAHSVEGLAEEQTGAGSKLNVSSSTEKSDQEKSQKKSASAKQASKLSTNQNQVSIFEMAEESENNSPDTDFERTEFSSAGRPGNENSTAEKSATMPPEQTPENQKINKDLNRTPFSDPTEQALLRILPRFPERLEQAVNEYKPNLITNYLFEVARAFSSFYNEVPVLNAGTPELKTARLKLVEATSQILKNGLKILGIEAFERM